MLDESWNVNPREKFGGPTDHDFYLFTAGYEMPLVVWCEPAAIPCFAETTH